MARKTDAIARAGSFPTNLCKREQKVVQVAEDFIATNSADWATLPATQDAAINALAALTGGGVEKMVVATYDFSVNGGTIGNKSLSITIPDNCIITSVIEDVVTDLTSTASTGTLRLNVATDGNLAAEIAADGSNIGILATVPLVKTTGARALQATIATNAVLAGKVRWLVKYVQSI